MTAVTGTPVDEAVEALRVARERVDEVAGTLAGYEAQAAGISAVVTAERALDDPDGAADDADRLDALRRRVTLTEAALEVAKGRAARAVSEALLAEADAHEPAVAAARDALDKHDATTRRLLAKLVDHSREHWVATPLAVDAADQHRNTDEQGNPRRVWSSLRAQLEGAVRDAQAVVDALRGAAEGRAVELPYERLPVCLRPGGWADLGRTTPEQEAETQRVNQARAELQDAEAFAAGSQRVLLAAIAAERREPRVPQRRREVQEAQARADQAAAEYEAARARARAPRPPPVTGEARG